MVIGELRMMSLWWRENIWAIRVQPKERQREIERGEEMRLRYQDAKKQEKGA